MYVLRTLAVVCLALLVNTQDNLCGSDTYGDQEGYIITIHDAYSAHVDFTTSLPLSYEKSHCDDVVGSWVEVCAYDDAVPEVELVNVDSAPVHRTGVHGEAVIHSRAFCRHPVSHAGVGASRLTPKVVPKKD